MIEESVFKFEHKGKKVSVYPGRAFFCGMYYAFAGGERVVSGTADHFPFVEDACVAAKAQLDALNDTQG